MTIEGADNGPNGFDCPDAQTYAAEKQTCTKGEATVTWDVRSNSVAGRLPVAPIRPPSGVARDRRA